MMPKSSATSSLGPSSRVAVRVPFVRPSLPPLSALVDSYAAIIQSRMLTTGPFLDRFERALADHLGVRHAVAVSSCTVGLMLAYKALDIAAGRCDACSGDRPACPLVSAEPLGRFGMARAGGRSEPVGEVVMPSFTFLAAPAAVVWNNLRPVFVDVDPDSTNVTPQSVAAAITPRTVAIAACHNFGNPCDVSALAAIAAEHALPLVIDAAHGFGARFEGRPVGAGATVQVFSLSPTKLLVAGEGGVVATDCDCVARLIRLGREYGNDGGYNAAFAGVNGRMPEVCAATGLAGLEILDEVAARRRQIAALYRAGLAGLPGIGWVKEASGGESSFKDFSITIDSTISGVSRDGVRRALAEQGIETRTYYDPPCHRQTAFEQFHDRRQNLPVTDALSATSLSLPIGAHVDEAIVTEVCRIIAGQVRSASF